QAICLFLLKHFFTFSMESKNHDSVTTFESSSPSIRCTKCVFPIVVGISGATRSGKSSLSNFLHKQLESLDQVICHDNYFRVGLLLLLNIATFIVFQGRCSKDCNWIGEP